MAEDGLYAALVRRGMSRRSFLRFSAAMAAALALPGAYAPRIARAIEAAPRIPVIWLRGQACGGDTEALLRSADPSPSSMLLDVLSVEYHESFLAAAGADATLVRTTAMERYPDGYVAVIEGAIPTGAAGAYCLVGGRPFVDVAREVADGAKATIAVGSCAFDGGAPGASGGPTGAAGVRQVVTDQRLITLPGCPMNVVNLAAVVVHYLAAGTLPPADPMGRPLFAYGGLIHNQCERRPHFEFGEFALSWGDEGAQRGWCLYKLGCKGPETMANCPTARYGGDLSWNVRAGHGCIGCTMPRFWDTMGPAYKRLPSPVPFMPNLTVDTVGAAMVGGIGGVAALHAGGMIIRQRRAGAAERRIATAAAASAGMEATAAGEPLAAAGVDRSAVPGGVAVAEPPAEPALPGAGALEQPAAPERPAEVEPQPATEQHATEPVIGEAAGDGEAASAAIVSAPAPAEAELADAPEPDAPAADAPPTGQAPEER